MRNAVVGFSGGIASGKSSLSTAVSEALGWPRTSFGSYIRYVASQSGLEPTRENCQRIGEHLIEQDAHNLCKSVLAQASWSLGAPLVIDGIRHLQVADLLTVMVRPSLFILIFVELPRADREIRLKNRDGVSQPLERLEHHSTETQASDLLARADLVIEARQPVEQLTDVVVRFLTARM
jgi:dephospho-CoA kinase